MCPSMVGVAFARQYREMFATVNLGNDLKFLFLTAWRNCELTGDSTVQWIYLMNLRVDGRSYSRRWYSVERTFELMGAVLTRMGWCSWLAEVLWV
jgi:hypothetical protein